MKDIKLDTKKLGIIIVSVVVILIIIVVAVSGGNKNKKESNTNNNSNNDLSVIEGEKLSEVKEYKGLEVSNVKFTIGEKMTRLTASVANKSSADREGQYVNINILDENGNRITSTMGWINPVKVGETTEIGASFVSTGKENMAHNIEITEKREKEDNKNGNSVSNNTNEN